MGKVRNKIGAAVIGVGRYGEVHVQAYKKSPLVELISIWSRSQKRAKKVGEKYDCEYTTDLERIAKDKRVQIISIATPDFAHAKPAIRMLRAGKHVLIEKPMATSVRECREILQVHRKSRTKLMVNFHNRWYPPIAEAKRRVDKGEIGKVVMTYARLSDRVEVPSQWLSTWASKSGPEWFLFPHIIDLVSWLTGKQRVRRVYALGKKEVLKERGIDTYDAVQAQVEFEETIAIFESSWILPSSWRNIIDFEIELVGSQGKIEIIGDREGINIAAGKYETPFVLDPITEEEPINNFIDCVLNDKEPTCSGEDGLAVTEIIEAIIKSLNKGHTVEVT